MSYLKCFQVFDTVRKECILAPDGFKEELLIPFYDKNNVEYQYDQEEFPRINSTILGHKFPELCNNPQSTKIIIEPANSH